MKKLSIVIPAYNEERTLEMLVNKVVAIELPENFSKEIIIGNDNSKDSTLEIALNLAAKNKEIKVFSNEKNLGKSQNVRKGILQTTGDYMIIQDADLEYEPNEIPELLSLALERDFDVVYGNRFGKKNIVIYWQNYIGNKFLSFFSNLFTYLRIKVWIPDMEVCYKLIKGKIAREIAETISSKSNFGFEPEVTSKLSKYKIKGKHLRFGVLPVSYYPRSLAEGKHMKAFRDGFKALREILIYNI